MPKRKRNKAYYKGSAGKKARTGGGPQPLTAGVKGILITTGDQGKFCVPEAYNLLNEYADQLYGPEVGVAQDSSPSNSESEEGKESNEGDWKRRGPEVGVAQSLEEEVAALKRLRTENKRRFSAMDTGAKHLVFIRCSDEVEPAQLVHSILQDAYNTKIRKSRYCQRLLPVASVCRANLTDLCEKTESVLLPYFHENYIDSHTYCVQFKSRNSDLLQRDTVLRMVADLVTREDEYPHRANLKNPEYMIDVNVIGGLCCIGVMTDYFKFRKYNLQALTPPTQEAVAADANMALPHQRCDEAAATGKGSSPAPEEPAEDSEDHLSDPPDPVSDSVPIPDPDSCQDSNNSIPAQSSDSSSECLRVTQSSDSSSVCLRVTQSSTTTEQISMTTEQTSSQSTTTDSNPVQKPPHPTDWAFTGSRKFDACSNDTAETLSPPLQSTHPETQEQHEDHQSPGPASPPPHHHQHNPALAPTSPTAQTAETTLPPNTSSSGSEDHDLPCGNGASSNVPPTEHKDSRELLASSQNCSEH